MDRSNSLLSHNETGKFTFAFLVRTSDRPGILRAIKSSRRMRSESLARLSLLCRDLQKVFETRRDRRFDLNRSEFSQ